MKVSIGKYPNRAQSNIHSDYMNWKYGIYWEENKNAFEICLEKIEDGIQWIYDNTINMILGLRQNRKIRVRIDPSDTYSMDHTLAHIILPMLEQLKLHNHGSPNVDDTDVPEELKSVNAPEKEIEHDIDENHHARWDWVMDEMIWAFKQKWRDECDENYYFDEQTVNRMSNGFRLFGKYYENLWD